MALTYPQTRELKKIADAGERGLDQGTGHLWSIRSRLKRLGFVDLRDVPAIRAGQEMPYPEARWFVTRSGLRYLTTPHIGWQPPAAKVN